MGAQFLSGICIGTGVSILIGAGLAAYARSLMNEANEEAERLRTWARLAKMVLRQRRRYKDDFAQTA